MFVFRLSITVGCNFCVKQCGAFAWVFPRVTLFFVYPCVAVAPEITSRAADPHQARVCTRCVRIFRNFTRACSRPGVVKHAPITPTPIVHVFVLCPRLAICFRLQSSVCKLNRYRIPSWSAVSICVIVLSRLRRAANKGFLYYVIWLTAVEKTDDWCVRDWNKARLFVRPTAV